jgi:hypothetical protein
LFLLGQTEHGKYQDPADEFDLPTLHKYYGVTRTKPSRREGESGAGHDDSEEEDGEDGDVVGPKKIAKDIRLGQQQQIRHPATDVPDTSSPFHNEIESEVFFTALEEVKAMKRIPDGFGLTDPYEPVETFRTGRARKGLTVSLPHDLWFPRILLWCQALHLLKRFPMAVRGE